MVEKGDVTYMVSEPKAKVSKDGRRFLSLDIYFQINGKTRGPLCKALIKGIMLFPAKSGKGSALLMPGVMLGNQKHYAYMFVPEIVKDIANVINEVSSSRQDFVPLGYEDMFPTNITENAPCCLRPHELANSFPDIMEVTL